MADGTFGVEIVTPERTFAPELGGLNHSAYAEIFHRHGVRITINSRLLSVRRGITVLTKCDAVDGETLDVVRAEVQDFLRGSFLDHPNPIVAVR